MSFVHQMYRGFVVLFCALILVLPGSASATTCADWEAGADPMFIFSDAVDYRGGDQRYQLFSELTAVNGEYYTYTYSLFDADFPFSPTEVWAEDYTTGEMDPFYYGFFGSHENLVIMFEGNTDWIEELFIFDPADESVMATMFRPGRALGLRDGILWIVDDFSPYVLRSYDLQDWPNLTEIGSVELPTNNRVYIRATGAHFVLPLEEKLYFLDLDDPANPGIAGSADVDYFNSMIPYAFGWDQVDDILYVGYLEFLTAIDYSDLMNPLILDRIRCTETISRIEVFESEGIVYNHSSDNFQVLSLADPENMVRLSGTIHESANASHNYHLSPLDFLYVTCGSNGVAMYDLADPADPVYVGRGYGYVTRIYPAGNWLLANGQLYPKDCLDVSPVVQGQVPRGLRLGGAEPNPFNPRTTVKFSLDRERMIDLSVFDLCGRQLCTLADELWPAGDNEVVWDGTDDRGRPLPSGTYFFKLQADEFKRTCRAALVR